MRGLRGLVLCIAAAAAAQEPLAIDHTTSVTGGVSVRYRPANGAERHLRIEVRPDRVRLLDETRKAGTGVLPIGSAEEQAVLTALNAWAATTFPPAVAERILASEPPPDSRPDADDDDDDDDDGDPLVDEAALLRALRAYEEVTQTTITKVFAGRGTVLASMQVQSGRRPPRLVVWQRRGDDTVARPCFDTSSEPVGFETRDERLLLLAMAHWLAPRLGGSDRLWQPEPADVPNDVRLVLHTFRSYRTATSPRLQRVAIVGDSGARIVHLVDEQDRSMRIRFDHTAGAATAGRMQDGFMRSDPVIDLGSAREKELLGALRKAAALRRAALGARAATDPTLLELDQELAAYHAALHAAPATK